jgi:CheY-like chemotaxis protein
MKILVVDNVRPVRNRLIEFIRSIGGEHTIIATASLREALDVLHLGAPQLILLDLRLEDGDGAEVLRSSKKKRSPPVVYVFTESADREMECLALGADGFFDKRGDPETLFAALERSMQEAFGHAGESEPWLCRTVQSAFQSFWSDFWLKPLEAGLPPMRQ